VRTVLGFERPIEDKEINVYGLESAKVYVEADPDMLHQIVYNLIENAVKFTAQKGIIEITYGKTEKWWRLG
jgi:signal transduction histidine kinase